VSVTLMPPAPAGDGDGERRDSLAGAIAAMAARERDRGYADMRIHIPADQPRGAQIAYLELIAEAIGAEVEQRAGHLIAETLISGVIVSARVPNEADHAKCFVCGRDAPMTELAVGEHGRLTCWDARACVKRRLAADKARKAGTAAAVTPSGNAA
jgi:hypothetical protein